MEKKRVIICLKHSKELQANFEATQQGSEQKLNKKAISSIGKIAGFKIDENFPPVAIPQELNSSEADNDDLTSGVNFNYELEANSFIIRGEINVNKVEELQSATMNNQQIVGVFADPEISSFTTCGNSAPVGNSNDVANKLLVNKMSRCGMDGEGVTVAIVDSGVNMNHLRSKGKNPSFNLSDSWKPNTTPSSFVPGSMPIGHGTMCAYDVTIAAPKCTLIDIALLQTRRRGRTAMSGFLSDVILAYRHLINIMRRETRPGENKSLVVNNSWGMFNPSWDFPVGHPSNYSDNPSHPFNIIVRSLERLGADILFAAGNCGEDCPDGRCGGVTTSTIYGANSSPYVTTVAGIDLNNNRVGYSSIGPGRLKRTKPDICGYTHFKGSGVYTADGGTSAACPVVAGVVTAIRSKRPLNTLNPSTRPSAIRSLITSNAIDLGDTGYDFKHGFGAISTTKIISKLCNRIVPINFCKRYPRICKNICLIRPDICDKIRRIRNPKLPPIPPIRRISSLEETEQNSLQYLTDEFDFSFENQNESFLDALEYMLSEPTTSEIENKEDKHDCNCKK